MAGNEELSSDGSAGRRRFRRPDAIEGDDLGRILALSDGVFAFAMTLLVLSLAVPVYLHRPTNGMLIGFLLGDWTALFGYVFAFVMIGIWWVVHHRTFLYIARFDSGLLWINMALLMEVAVMPFVLSFYLTYDYRQVAVVLFDVIQIALGLTSTVLWEYAKRQRLTKPEVPAAAAKFFTDRGLASSAVFAASIGISFVNVSAAQYFWVAVFVVQRLLTVAGD
jgi:uncharacterized membrane protein